MATVEALKTFATGSKKISKGEQTTLPDGYANELKKKGVVKVIKEGGEQATQTEARDEPVGEPTGFKCADCGQSFPSRRGLTIHQNQKHK